MANLQFPRIIVALDQLDKLAVIKLSQQLDPNSCYLKIGKELFTRYGPSLVEQLQQQGFQIFLDLKFHDIPTTVAKACEAAADLHVWMVSVHAWGGRTMLEAARNALDNRSGKKPLLIGVTVLTSLAERDLQVLGWKGSLGELVVRLATLTKQAGLEGVVCSPQEIAILRKTLGEQFCLVTPGIRPAGDQQNDQQRVMTPHEAACAGANYLVIGRPITQALDPLNALKTIQLDIAAVGT